MYVCVYSYQTTEPICIKIIQQIERLTLIAIVYLDLKYLFPPYLKPPKTHFRGPRNGKPMGNRGLHISGSNWERIEAEILYVN